MKIVDLWNTSEKPTISFELFPARSEKGAASLEKTIDTLAALNPDFVSVTFGAGGSTREGSRQLIHKLKHKKGLDIIAYFACYDLGPDDIVAVLDRATRRSVSRTCWPCAEMSHAKKASNRIRIACHMLPI